MIKEAKNWRKSKGVTTNPDLLGRGNFVSTARGRFDSSMPGNDNWNCVRTCAFEYSGTKSGRISKITGGEVVLFTTVTAARSQFPASRRHGR